MRLVDDQPVRTTGLGPQISYAGKQRHEERGAIGKFESQQIDDRVLAGLGQQLHALVHRRRALRTAQYRRAIDGIVITFRVDDAEAVTLRAESLDEACR